MVSDGGQDLIENRLLTVEDFRAEIGAAFYVPFNNGVRITLRLREVRSLQYASSVGRAREPFLLEFVDTGPFGFVTATYRVYNERLGWQLMRLSPGDWSASTRIYRAIYN